MGLEPVGKRASLCNPTDTLAGLREERIGDGGVVAGPGGATRQRIKHSQPGQAVEPRSLGRDALALYATVTRGHSAAATRHFMLVLHFAPPCRSPFRDGAGRGEQANADRGRLGSGGVGVSSPGFLLIVWPYALEMALYRVNPDSWIQEPMPR